MRHLVIGTAGHIDHGKSALVHALTGIDPDRLQEEKRRGITIELGFADVVLDPGHVVSFVDVPGHERFVRHMVAGAAGIEAVLLVVAADQGVQPQTREHLAICKLLGLGRGVVALTKCDLVDAELREVVALELGELLEGSFLDGAPIVPVSARTGAGLDELRRELGALFEHAGQRDTDGVPRLPVDRSFVLRGFGTVVTGTLVSGAIGEGDEVEVLPSGARARIRGIQVHREATALASAGQRTAVNLQGVDCADVPRGSTVTRPACLRTTRRLWARVRLLPHAPSALRSGGSVRFHQGTCERAARYRVLSRSADGTLHAVVYLRGETVLAPGDRFILRCPAPVDTVGGGTVVDIDPPHPRSATPQEFAVEALELQTALTARLRRAGPSGCEPRRLAAELGRSAPSLERAVAVRIESGEVVVVGARWVDGRLWRDVERRALDELAAFHRQEPLQLGITREGLRARTCAALPQEAWRRLLEGLAARSRVRLEGERVAAIDHDVQLDGGQQRIAEEVEQTFRRAGLEPPDLEQAAADADRTRIVELLVARGKLVRLHDGKLFHADALAELRQRLRSYARRSRTIGVAEFKELAGVTRKHAIPLLEFLDAEHTTRRVGNQREILDPGG